MIIQKNLKNSALALLATVTIPATSLVVTAQDGANDFSAIDTNKDGVITREEMTSVYLKLVAAEAEKQFSGMDLDENGIITEDEIRLSQAARSNSGNYRRDESSQRSYRPERSADNRERSYRGERSWGRGQERSYSSRSGEGQDSHRYHGHHSRRGPRNHGGEASRYNNKSECSGGACGEARGGCRGGSCGGRSGEDRRSRKADEEVVPPVEAPAPLEAYYKSA